MRVRERWGGVDVGCLDEVEVIPLFQRIFDEPWFHRHLPHPRNVVLRIERVVWRHSY